MVRIIIILLLFSCSIQAQVLDTVFNGYLNPFRVNSGSAPTWIVQGRFINEGGTFTGAEVSADSKIIVAKGGRCYELTIDSLISSSPTLIAKVTDSTSTLTNLPVNAAIARPDSNNLFPYIAGLPEVLQACIQSQNWLRTVSSTGTSSPNYDSNKPILRVPGVGDNIAASTVTGWLDYWYFSAPTLSLNLSPATTIYEVGDTSYITVSGTTSNPGAATLSSGGLDRTAPGTLEVDAFGTGTSYSFSFSFYPQKDSTTHYKQLSYSFQASQDWAKGAESGTATSTTRTVTAVYPVLYGMSATDLSVTGNPYTVLTKLVEAEGNKTVTLTGSGFIYYAIPKTWGDFTLSQIVDHNGFDVTPSFTSYDITVSSSSLINNWTSVNYKLYKLNTTTTTSGYAYQFIR